MWFLNAVIGLYPAEFRIRFEEEIRVWACMQYAPLDHLPDGQHTILP